MGSGRTSSVNRVLADSSFWVALRVSRDVNHEAARILAARLLRERTRLVVTPLIFAEVHARCCRSVPLREQVIRDIWENPVIEVEHLEPPDYQRAVELLRAQQDKDYPFCDATSFVLMQRLEITRAASYDDHFRQFGRFEVLG
ncbi:MAG: hypothetical protein QOE70_4869 [Chthoniobacter sp.]|jgi:predicted nucleic acid-binding protein|nr:hypothetical protein [Chthoniobacter sp.]